MALQCLLSLGNGLEFLGKSWTQTLLQKIAAPVSLRAAAHNSRASFSLSASTAPLTSMPSAPPERSLRPSEPPVLERAAGRRSSLRPARTRARGRPLQLPPSLGRATPAAPPLPLRAAPPRGAGRCIYLRHCRRPLPPRAAPPLRPCAAAWSTPLQLPPTSAPHGSPSALHGSPSPSAAQISCPTQFFVGTFDLSPVNF